MSQARPAYLRTACSPRMIGLLVLFLAIAAVCARLGVWQLDRAQERAAAEPDEPVAPVELVDVLAPQEAFSGELVGRSVVVSGRFGADEVVVPGQVDGVEALLVVTPFVVEQTGATLAVVRGWVADPLAADDAPAPEGVVEVRGRLEGGEAARGELTSVSPAELVNRWGGPIYSGYVVLEAPHGALMVVPPPEPDRSLNLQNLAYALQWWIFGGFAVLLWARMVRDEARQDAPLPDDAAPGESDDAATSRGPDDAAPGKSDAAASAVSSRAPDGAAAP